MSKISLAPDVAGTGIFTIASPNSNTNRTLTLPDDTGTIVTNSGNQAGSFTTLNTSGAVVFNDAGADVDFRVEGDTEANLLFVDASTDAIGIGTNTTTDAGVTITRSVTRDSSWDAKLALQSTGSNDFPALFFSGCSSTSRYGAIVQTTSTSGTGTNTPITAQIAFPLTSATEGNITFSTNGNIGTTNPTERMRITNGGVLLVNDTSNVLGTHLINRSVAAPNDVFGIISNTEGRFVAIFSAVDGSNENAANTAMKIGRNAGTLRSINAGGTVNASGADYAEYMAKAGEFDIAKGDICGVNSDGKLTNVFADAVAFVVKSTNPSYVGGDVWGTEDVIGKRPKQPTQKAAEVDEEGNETQASETDEDFAARVAQYESDLAKFEAKLEAERQKVDRIAFSGQVPVNVTGATAGQYIVPVESNGGITGLAVNEADMTLAQYMKAVGKVIAIEDDGRARIIVKVA